MTPNATPVAILDNSVQQTIQEVVVTASLERSVRRMTEVTLTVAELSKRMEEAGFTQLASAVRAATEGTLVGFLSVLPSSPVAEPTLQKPVPRLTRKAAEQS